MRAAAQPDKGGLAASFGRIADGLSRLISEHLALARVELRHDARALAMDLVRIGMFLPLVIVGYGLLCTALALALGTLIGLAGAFAVVGGANVILGGLGVFFAAMKLKERPVLERTRVEVERTTHALANVARPSGNGVERRLGA